MHSVYHGEPKRQECCHQELRAWWDRLTDMKTVNIQTNKKAGDNGNKWVGMVG